jgi:TM2 domain-containing membrane protein YozV
MQRTAAKYELGTIVLPSAYLLLHSFERNATMYPIDPIYTANMNEQQRAWFYAEYERARKDEVIGVLLAVFLGGLGIHHFYLRRDGLGLLYLLFSWTGIPMVIAWIEAFFMPRRVRQYNAAQAMFISSQILAAGSSQPGLPATCCNACGNPIDSTAVFCNHCGAAVTRSALNTQPAH